MAKKLGTSGHLWLADSRFSLGDYDDALPLSSTTQRAMIYPTMFEMYPADLLSCHILVILVSRREILGFIDSYLI